MQTLVGVAPIEASPPAYLYLDVDCFRARCPLTPEMVVERERARRPTRRIADGSTAGSWPSRKGH